MGVSVTDGEWRYTEWRNAETQELFFKELYSHRESDIAEENVAGKEEHKALEQRLKVLLDRKFPTDAPSFHEKRKLGNNLVKALP